MAIPRNRIDLIQYCKRTLGAPVLQINVDDAQVEDRIDEALQFYQEYHSDAIYRVFHKHQITQDDIDTLSVPIPDAITTIVRILPINSLSQYGSGGMFDVKYQLMLNDMYNLGFTGNLLNFNMMQQYLSLLDNVINTDPTITFNRHMNRIYLEGDSKKYLKVGSFIIVEAYRIVDPDTHGDVYNDMFLKRYATALIKRQWAVNLKKFEGMQLPGGVVLNGQQMYDEANTEIQQIEEDMQLKYEKPIDFFVG